MKKSFWKLSLFFAGFAAIGLVASSCSSDDDDNDVEAKAPVAKFSESVDGLKVTFTNESSDATTYTWEFGDSETSTDKNPVHTYAEAGKYSVKLTAKGAGGENAVTKEVEVTDEGGDPSVSVIKVDGDFSDWAEVPAADLYSAVLDEAASDLKRLKEVKVTSDDMYIYFYFKLDSEHANAMDIYINNDLSPETGYNGWMWKELAANYLMQGFYADNYDMRLAPYDESKDGGWGWLDNLVDTGSGLMENSEFKTVSGTIIEFESKVVRDFIPELGSEIRISFGHSGVEGDAWSTSGGLPTVPAEGDKNEGLLVKLK